MHHPLRFAAHVLLAAGCLSFTPHPRPDSALILGTWVSAADAKSRVVFTKSSCTQYYGGQPLRVYRYTLSNKSPQCGTKVPVEPATSYLQLTNSAQHLLLCYELTSLDANNLAYRPVATGRVLLFERKR